MPLLNPYYRSIEHQTASTHIALHAILPALCSIEIQRSEESFPAPRLYAAAPPSLSLWSATSGLYSLQ